MPSTLLYGPDGGPLLTTATVDDDIAKKVRSAGVSVTTVWDKERGKPKPTPVTFETLRLMAARNEWVRAIIKTRKNQIGGVGWSIVPRDEHDSSGSTSRMCADMTELLRRPGLRGSRPTGMAWRQFIGMVLEDLLVLDAGVIEKERDGKGWIVGLYPVDGATIRPNMDEFGGFEDDAYVQVVDGQVTARFGVEDLVYLMDNPQTDVRFAGYGFSPLENLIMSVTADLYAARYNADYFEKGTVPEGLLHLGADVDPEDVNAFRLYWRNEIQGKPHALPIIGGGERPDFIRWRDNNRDMQFMEYQQWLLKRLCAVYQIPPQEVGELEDVNRSTANDQARVNRSKSIEPILSLVKDYLDTEVIGVHGQGVGDYVEFAWDADEVNEAEVNGRFQVMIAQGAATRNEWREELGMEPGTEEGMDMFLTDGQPSPLPDEATVEQRRKASAQPPMPFGGQGGMPFGPGNQPDGPPNDQAPDSPPDGLPPGLGKRERDGMDRNPALTGLQDEVGRAVDERRNELIGVIADVLNVPEWEFTDEPAC